MSALSPNRTYLPLQRELSVFVGTLLTLCLFLYLGPYYGIRHDSVLYLGQALLRWHPNAISNDLFFAFGSQASYTLFPELLAALLQRFPAGDVFAVLTLGARILFLIASYLLIREILPSGFRYLGLLALLILPPFYGSHGIFSYGESFLTARSFAEPLVLLSLAACLRRSWIPAAVLWVLAAALHPLQALPAALVIWVYLALLDRRWLRLLWVLAPLPLIVLLSEQVRDGLLSQIDSDWLTWVLVPSKHLFLLQWRLSDWARLGTDVFLAALILRTAEGALASAARALLVTTTVTFAASLLLADLLNLALPTSLQLWRAHWLLHWFALATLPFSLMRSYTAARADRVPPLTLATIAVLGALGSPVGPGLIPLFVLWPRIRHRVGPSVRRLLILGLVVALALVLLASFVAALRRFDYGSGMHDLVRVHFLLLSHPLAMGSLVALGIWLWRRGNAGVRVLMMSLLVGWAVYGGLAWDRRTLLARHLEDFQAAQPSVFGVTLAEGAQVLWLNDGWIDAVLASWLVLERPSYFSPHQQAGLVFSRATAAEAHRRLEITEGLRTQQFICNAMNEFNATPGACVPSDLVLAETCEMAQGGLQYVITHYTLTAPPLGAWAVPMPGQGRPPQTYYLYQCADLVKSAEQS